MILTLTFLGTVGRTLFSLHLNFSRPADLPSFAFINMTHDKSNKYMSGLFESMEKHGIILPQNVDCRYALEHVTCNMKVTRSPDPEHVSFSLFRFFLLFSFLTFAKKSFDFSGV